MWGPGVFFLRKLRAKAHHIFNANSWGRALLWSLIAAAFIGPGTIATATHAGSLGGFAYLPAVGLAVVAGYIFMEMAARLTIVSGRPLGALVARTGRFVPALLFVAVVFGCAAYQAGNLLGALGGFRLLFSGTPRWAVVVLAAAIVLLLWSGSTRVVARVMAYLVAGMGLLFVVAAVQLSFSSPGGPGGTVGLDSAILLGLLGTTIVPYNFFLAAGLGSQQSSLGDMRWGLGLSFLIGGLITASVLIVGTRASGFSNFEDLATAIELSLGNYGRAMLGAGLFAAGFSSATTAPLAAAIAGRALLGERITDTAYRLIWGGVLLVGLTVSLFDLDTVGVILAAQIVNGLLLPMIALLVIVLANRPSVLGEETNRIWQNVAGTLVLCFLWYKAGQFLFGLFI